MTSAFCKSVNGNMTEGQRCSMVNALSSFVRVNRIYMQHISCLCEQLSLTWNEKRHWTNNHDE